jgi:uroporphyrinogen decarboxylase
MSTINMQEWKKRLLQQEERSAMPIMTHPGINMIGKKVIDAVTDGRVHFQAIRAMADHYPSIAATMIMDLTVEAEAFGSRINFTENEVPAVSERLVYDHKSVCRLAVPGISAGRVPQYLTAARLAAENIRDRPVFGGCIGPFSLASRLFDMTEIMTEVIMVPETIEALLVKCTAFLKQYVRAMKDCGLNGIIIAEPAAGLLDEALCDRFSTHFVRKIVEDTQDENFMVILHNCGNHGHVTGSMIRTGAQGLHFGNHIDMSGTLRTVPGHILVFGNLDPVGALKMALPHDLSCMAAALIESARDYPNFVLSTGCDTPPGVPEENIRAFFSVLNSHAVM